jgi:subtilase family serine protease
MRPTLIAGIFATVPILCLAQAPTPDAIKSEAKRQVTAGIKPALSVQTSSMNICSGPIPAGWIVINNSWNPTVCGMPATIVYNVLTITQYSVLPVGSTLNVCADPSVPPTGWVTVNTAWSPTSCGYPALIIQNVVMIRRVAGSGVNPPTDVNVKAK